MRTLILLLFTLTPLTLLQAASTHQHGVAQLDLVLEPPMLAIGFSSPLANLNGYEHQPVSAEERQAWSRLLAQLKSADALIQLPAHADCSLSRVDLHLPFTTDKGEHDHRHTTDAPHPQHADLMAEYLYLCANSTAITQLVLPLLPAFPAIERLNVQLITPAGQHSSTLTQGQTELQLP
ncbi:MAG: DUF2796 domain-containing protein [Oceanospirillales bacterium]|nr:DUF2796 domain-containing protein [Oceanospirillales bacterium]